MGKHLLTIELTSSPRQFNSSKLEKTNFLLFLLHFSLQRRKRLLYALRQRYQNVNF